MAVIRVWKTENDSGGDVVKEGKGPNGVGLRKEEGNGGGTAGKRERERATEREWISGSGGGK